MNGKSNFHWHRIKPWQKGIQVNLKHSRSAIESPMRTCSNCGAGARNSAAMMRLPPMRCPGFKTVSRSRKCFVPAWCNGEYRQRRTRVVRAATALVHDPALH